MCVCRLCSKVSRVDAPTDREVGWEEYKEHLCGLRTAQEYKKRTHKANQIILAQFRGLHLEELGYSDHLSSSRCMYGNSSENLGC